MSNNNNKGRLSKTDIASKLTDKIGKTKKEATEYVDNILYIIQDNLAKGNDISFVGFGSFTVKTRKAREGRNPQTGETIQIKEKKVIKFKAGKALEDEVN